MSLLEPRLGDLRAGFGGLGFSSGLSMPSSQVLPLWRPPLPPATWCTIPSCPCAMSRPLVSRSYLMSDMYDYPPYSYPWSSWYLKAAQDSSLYKGLPLGPPPLECGSLEPRPSHRDDGIDHRSSPGKELPTKSRKQERHKERLEMLKPLNFDKEHAAQHRQVVNTASRMHLPSVSPPPPPPVDQYHNGDSVSEAYRLHHHKLISSHPALRSPPQHPPPQYQPPRDLPSPNEAPLNLSITNGSNSASDAGNHGGHSPSQSRPSVITCATSVSVVNGRYESSGSVNSSPSRREIQSDICDPEEHFRRALGKNYTDFMGKHSSATPSPPPPLPPPHPATLAPLPPQAARQMSPCRASSPAAGPKVKAIINSNVSITGSVDDHFARALGDSTWSKLKAKNDPQEAPMPGSVDDHFAKALGDTWLRIKAERESPRGPPPPFPMSMPMSIPHPISHGHTLPPHHPPRASSPSAPSHTTSLVST